MANENTVYGGSDDVATARLRATVLGSPLAQLGAALYNIRIASGVPETDWHEDCKAKK